MLVTIENTIFHKDICENTAIANFYLSTIMSNKVKFSRKLQNKMKKNRNKKYFVFYIENSSESLQAARARVKILESLQGSGKQTHP